MHLCLSRPKPLRIVEFVTIGKNLMQGFSVVLQYLTVLIHLILDFLFVSDKACPRA